MKSDLHLYGRLLAYAKPYWKIVVISVFAMICSAALEPVIPGLMEPLINKSLIEKNPTSLWQVPLFIFLAFTLKGLADYASSVASQYVAQRTIADLRQRVFSHQLDLPIEAHQKEDSGRMLTRVTYDTAMVGDAVSSAWLILIRDSLVLIGLIGFLFYTSWQLTLVILGAAPIVALLLRYASKRIRISSEKVQTWTGALSGFVNEALLGLKEVKIFRNQELQEGRFEQTNQSLRREQMRIIRVQSLNVPLVQVLAATTVSLVIFVASKMSARNLLTPGEFVAFITAMSMVFEPIRRLTNVNTVLQKGLAAAQSIFSVLDQQTEAGQSTSLATPLQRARGLIEFKNVSFSYPGQDSPAIANLSFSVSPSESVAVIGQSGSGKSTLLYLLARFAKPQSGQIFLDGRPINEWPLSELRHNISLVGQHVMLFDGSIRENIAMGRPNALEDEIISAAKAANAWEFISQLPERLDTPLGSLGSRLSGGQRQRIAIARAFLKDAPILLLDEATSALDRESESYVMSGLQELMKGRTTLIVSHNPERLLHVDHTIILKPGTQ